jgi:PEP-CTERM motif-containing protein
MRQVTAVVLLGLMACGTAWGALDTSNAYVDGDSFTWAGSTDMTNQALSASVEWCVDDQVGGLFKYNYQLTLGGTAPLTLLSVGMLDSNEAQNIGSAQIDPTDVAPASAYFGGPAPNLSSANWEFAALSPGQVSYELSYWSVNEPLMFAGQIQDTGLIAGGLVPSPSDEIPEPATLGLLALGAVAGLIRRR